MSGFREAAERIGGCDLRGRTLLVPIMHPVGSRLVAAAFRAVGVDARNMETGRGLDAARELTSGKECYPCQVTLGDVVHHLRGERERLGAAFEGGRYAYFMPRAGGPCRFGMYAVFQKLALDRFPEFREMRVVSLTTSDGYDASGVVPRQDASALRLMLYMAVTAGDVLDRILWRARPYERRAGAADELFAAAAAELEAVVESGGLRRDFRPLRDVAARAAREARGIVDPALPRRPRIGIVGEIFLRTHPGSNQELIRSIERHGGEVVDASLAEWLCYTSFCRARDFRREALRNLRSRRIAAARRSAGGWLGQAAEYRYLDWRRRWMYAPALEQLDISPDHAVHEAGRRLDGERHFSFDVGTEAVLSIGGALEYVRHGCDGVVNVFPFTCMPGTMASAVLSPLLAGMGVPFLEVPCDESERPNRETAIRTFVWQAAQRRERRGAAAAH